MASLTAGEKVLESFSFIQEISQRSLKLCAQLEEELDGLEFFSVPIACIFAVGSAGRLEIGPCSDLDGVVVLRTGVSDLAEVDRAMQEIEAIYRKLGFQVPKSSGIYRSPIQQIELLDITQRGRLDEHPQTYGKRIQILLDARPIFNPKQFFSLQQQVLNWFLPVIGGRTSYTFLINELQRYFHSYASWQYFKFEQTQSDGWYLRQAKLRVTRVITVGAMMLLIGISMASNDNKILSDHLAATPLERLVFAFKHYGEDEMCERFVMLYERALRLLLDENVRNELIQKSPARIEDLDRPMPAAYRKIHEASEELMALLTRFVLNRDSEWPVKFYRNWMF